MSKASRGFVLVLTSAIAACALPDAPPCQTGGNAIALVQRGIHVELLVPRAIVAAGLPVVAERHAGAAYIGFGFGKEGIIGVTNPNPLALLLAIAPGPAVVEVNSVAAMPANAVRLALPEAARAPLLTFLRDAKAVAPELPDAARPGRSHHAAVSLYTLAYNCNTWLADALAQAGLPFHTRPGQTSGMLMAQARRVPGACVVTDAPGLPAMWSVSRSASGEAAFHQAHQPAHQPAGAALATAERAEQGG